LTHAALTDIPTPRASSLVLQPKATMKHSIAAFFVLAACQTPAAPPVPRASVHPAHLRCEHKVDPLGIGTAAPVLDWRVEAVDARERGLTQSAWQILVASDAALLANDRGDLWDSGEVKSASTTNVQYRGRPLAFGSAAHWKVRVWDQNGRRSGWSAPATFTVGPLDRADWQAQWIGWDAPLANSDHRLGLDGAHWIWTSGDDALHTPACERWFRGHFEAPAPALVHTAVLLVSVDNYCDVYWNGERLGGNADELDGWRHVLRFDVAPKLHAGGNVIAIRAENAAVSPAGVIAKLVVNAGETGALVATSDASWRASDRAFDGWNAERFDDAQWPAAEDLGAYGVEPWTNQVFVGLVLPPPRLLRKPFMIPKSVRRATVYASALGLYQLELNGARVGRDSFTPGWTDYEKRVHYEAYDVTSRVHGGTNALGATLADGWYAGYVGYGGRRDHYGKATRFLAELVVEHDDGTRTVIGTDGSWRAATGPLSEADFLMGESYDARAEAAGWSTGDFDDHAWSSVVVDASIKASVEAHPGMPVREIAELAPRSTREVAPDVYVMDLGQNIAGVARLKVRGAAGRKITLRYAERVNADGTLYTANLRGARATDTYVCKGGAEESWQPQFTFHGFQYIEVSGLGAAPEPGAVLGIALSSDTPMVSEFETSDATVNKIYRNTWWTQRMNFIDVPTDCPQRDERLGWTGDAQTYIRTACFLSDAQAFYTKWLVDLEDAQRADGQFPAVAPLKVAGGDGGPAWSDAGVVCPSAVFDTYDDRPLLERHYESMKRFVEFCEKRSLDLLPPKSFHCFGDWVSLNAETPHEVIFEAYFAGSARLLAKCAAALGRDEDAARFAKLYEHIRGAFNRAYVDAQGRIQGDTQCDYVLALAFDLVDGERRTQAARRLVELIAERDWHLSTGFVGTRDLMLVLSKIGRTDVAYRLLHNKTFPSWGFEIENGATSIWERWDGWTSDKGFQDPTMNSFAHYAFGAVTQWMFETIGGIRALEPGFAKILIRPEPGGELTHARTSYDSIRGPIETEWKLSDGRFLLDVIVPPNAVAEIHVPTLDAESVTESGRPARSSPGVTFVRRDAEEAVYAIGSGRYAFACGAPVVRRLRD
jgi:alpha-L-rhamnosidase